MDELNRNKAIVRSFVDTINQARWDKLGEYVSADFIRHSYAAGDSSVTSIEELIDFLKAESKAFPDGREELLDLIAEGDRVAARHRFVGTQTGALGDLAPTGRRMMAEYLAIYRIADNRIVEAWAEWDNLSGRKQLGHAADDR